MKTKLLILISAILLIGLSIWELYPVRKSTKQLEFNQDGTIQLPQIKCAEINEILGRPWEITYPLVIPKGESQKISLFLLDNPHLEISEQKNTKPCNSAIEVRLNLPELSPKPAEYILSPYYIESFQRFEWDIKAEDKDLKGTIWIYLLVREKYSELSRIPLFAIPIEINVISFMGISPRSVRIILAGLTIIATFILFFYSAKKTNDII